MDNFATNHRRFDLNLFQAVYGHFEGIFGEHQQIGELSSFDRPLEPFLEADIGGVGRIETDGLHHAEPLFRADRSAAPGLASHHTPDAPPRVQRFGLRPHAVRIARGHETPIHERSVGHGLFTGLGGFEPGIAVPSQGAIGRRNRDDSGPLQSLQAQATEEPQTFVIRWDQGLRIEALSKSFTLRVAGSAQNDSAAFSEVGMETPGDA